MKTKSTALDALKTKVLSMHPYKVPEFIALPVSLNTLRSHFISILKMI
ncbi:unnamed protein product [Brugia timori]|uniref:Uncharacterized protein n=1 Tax=Brugia timori TaxID=42155 RepID=A0A0R3QCQ4_9BILA|nr:unnamed protein product [Brugia timori]